jgi:uncharacterized protein YjiS (DUF1127 family)
MTVVSHRAETNRRMSTMCRTLCASFRQLMARRRFRSEYQRALFELKRMSERELKDLRYPTPRGFMEVGEEQTIIEMSETNVR